MRLSKKWLFIISLSSVGVYCFANAYAIAEPQDPLGRARFHLLYNMADSKKGFLSTYTRELADFNGMCIPDEIDRFLVDRIGKCSSQELSDIVDFYVTHAYGRLGRELEKSPPRAKQRVIS